MTERVTSTVIEEELEKLSTATGREFQLDSWAPGDGWSRYQLFLKNEDGPHRGLQRVTNVLNNREMYNFIRGYIKIRKMIK